MRALLGPAGAAVAARGSGAGRQRSIRAMSAKSSRVIADHAARRALAAKTDHARP
jgi:hypothetical protein